MSEKLPTSVRDVKNADAWNALVKHVSEGDSLVDGDRRAETLGTAVAVDWVARVAELEGAMNREDKLHRNEVLDLIDAGGLALRLPEVSDTRNKSHLLAFYPWRQAFLETIAEADKKDDLELPDDERTRRALLYAGAELVADRILEQRQDTGDENEHEDGNSEAGADPLRGPGDGTALDDEEVAEMIDKLREAGILKEMAAEFGVGEEELDERLREIQEEHVLASLKDRIGDDPETGGNGDDAEAEADEDDPEADATVDPTEGVLGHDWVRAQEQAGERSWSGRPLRSLLYALVEEVLDIYEMESGLRGRVDRVDLINYGEPTLDGDDLPFEFETRQTNPEWLPEDKYHEYALDARIEGDFFRLPKRFRTELEIRLGSHLEFLHTLSHYETEMREDLVTDRGESEDEPDEAVAETVDSSRADGGADDGVPFRELPKKLQASRDRLFDDMVDSEMYDDKFQLTDDAINVASYHRKETKR